MRMHISDRYFLKFRFLLVLTEMHEIVKNFPDEIEHPENVMLIWVMLINNVKDNGAKIRSDAKRHEWPHFFLVATIGFRTA